MDEEVSNKNLCKFLHPERVSGHFICYYLIYHKNNSKKEFLKDFSTSMAELGLERVLNVYARIEQEMEEYANSEKYDLAGDYKGMLEYFKEHVLDKTELPKNS